MPADEIAFAAPTGLTATLAGPFDIDLRWKDNASEEGGYFIEYANHPEDGFILLAAVSQDGTAFRHADLVPETRFIYRVRPFFGRASKVAEVRTGKAAAEDAAGALEEPTPGPPGDKPLRTTSGAAQAAATDLRVRLVAPTRVELKWRDRARDEDGYLVEVTADLDEPFKVGALLDPNVTSYVFANLPPETRCHFRVRAFFYGEPSNLAEKSTGAQPPTR